MKMHMVAALNQAMDQLMSEDQTIVALGEDVGVDGGVFRVTDGLQAKHGEQRVIDTPLAEAGIIGCATGMAINGLKPVAEIQFSGFSYQGFHHVKQHLSRFRQRSNGTIGVPVVVRAPCAGGIRALEHHSESPETFFAHTQGVKVVVPSGPYNAKGLLTSAIKDPDPVIFLEPKSVYRSFKEEVPEESYEIPLGKANVVQEGTDVTIVTWGAMLRTTQQALEGMEVSAEVIDLQTIWPFDTETIFASAKKTGRVVIVHEAPRNLGVGAEIASRIQEELILHLQAPIKRCAAYDIPFPPFALENYFIPNKERVAEAIKETMEF